MRKIRRGIARARKALTNLDLGKVRRKLAKRQRTRKQKRRARKALVRQRAEAREKLDSTLEQLEQAEEDSDRAERLEERVASLRQLEEGLTREIRRTRRRLHALADQITDLHPKVRRRRKKKRKLNRRIERGKKRLQKAREKRKDKLGTGDLGGSRSITDQIVEPEYDKAGVPVTSRKRPASHPLSRSNPSSDHNEANVTADALDGGTANNFTLARRAAAKIASAADEVQGSWDGDYDTFNVRFGDRWFRIQIIAGTHGTGAHIHEGTRRL